MYFNYTTLHNLGQIHLKMNMGKLIRMFAHKKYTSNVRCTFIRGFRFLLN